MTWVNALVRLKCGCLTFGEGVPCSKRVEQLRRPRDFGRK
jgi:hypothetical protein